MESNATQASAKPAQKKKGGFWRVLLTILLLAVLAVGCLILYRGYNTETEDVSVTRYKTSTITEGEINTTLSGSSTLAVTDSLTATAPAAVTVEKINYNPGDTVPAGSVVMTLSSDDVNDQLTTLYTELQTAQTKLAATTKKRSRFTVVAPKKGIVKDIRVASGDACDDLDYLCVISTDELMKVTLAPVSGMRLYETVYVTLNGETVEGTINRMTAENVEITFDDNNYAIGTVATVRSASGADYGSAAIDVNDSVLVIQSFGCIDEVRVTENQSVSKNTTLFTLTEDTPSDSYHTKLVAVQEIEDEIQDLKDSLKVTTDWDAMLATVSVTEGQEVASGTTLCYLVKNDGYTLSLNVDEDDIASVSIGQDVSITLDALDGTYSGKVTNLSYSGSGSYITSFTATIKTDPIEGAYPGMSVTANVITSTSGKALVVPVDAVQYEGDSTYLLLAGDSDSSSSSSNRGSRKRNKSTTATTDAAATAAPEAAAAQADASSAATDAATADSSAVTDAAATAESAANGAPAGSPGTGDGSMPSMPEGFDSSNMTLPDGATMPAAAGTSTATETETNFFKKIWNKIKSLWNKLVALITGKDTTDTSNVAVFNADDYERLTVTTGMSDGSYIVVSGDGVTAGTRIIVPVLETTATYTSDDSTTTTSGFNFGGMDMGGGGMPNMGGGDMGGGNSGRSDNSGRSNRN